MMVIVAIIVILAGVLIYLLTRPKEVIKHEVEEVSLDNDICKIIDQREITPNKSLILGVDKGIIIFNNSEVVYKEESYSIDYDVISKFFKEDNESGSLSQDTVTCYKVKKGAIKDIETKLTNGNYYFDNFYNVLVQIEVSLRATYEVVDYDVFLKDIVFFRKQYSFESFKKVINQLISAKVFASISSYIQSNNISYLHISLYKHEIEELVINNLNEYLQTLGINVLRLTFTDIVNVEDNYYNKLSKGILEKSKMSIIDYTYKDKMNNELGIIEDELNDEKPLKEAKVYIK